MAAIDIVFPGAHEPHNGIADHTKRLTHALEARGHDVRVIACGEDPGGQSARAVDGWPNRDLADVDALVALVVARAPDLLLVQFEQFAYGRRGRNSAFSHFFERVKDEAPHATRVLFVHETYPSPTSPKRAAMWSYQRLQLRALARSANSVLVTCDAWRERLRRLGSVSAVAPVPSAIPDSGQSRDAARGALGLGDQLVVTVFGYMDDWRGRYVSAALPELDKLGATLMYVGKDAGTFREHTETSGIPTRILANASPVQVSTALNASDMALAPYPDGASTRRSGLMALLEHRVPTVTTLGSGADGLMRELTGAGALVTTTGGAAGYARAVAAIAAEADARAALRGSLAARQDTLPTWQSTAESIEAALAGASG